MYLQAFGSNGYVDFYLNKKRWAIELLRDSSDVNQHLARFRPGGLYHSMLQNGSIQAYIVVDLRGPHQPSRSYSTPPDLFTFNFDGDYTTAIFVHEGKPDGELLIIGG